MSAGWKPRSRRDHIDARHAGDTAGRSIAGLGPPIRLTEFSQAARNSTTLVRYGFGSDGQRGLGPAPGGGALRGGPGRADRYPLAPQPHPNGPHRRVVEHPRSEIPVVIPVRPGNRTARYDRSAHRSGSGRNRVTTGMAGRPSAGHVVHNLVMLVRQTPEKGDPSDRSADGGLLHRRIDPGRSVSVLRVGAQAGSGVARAASRCLRRHRLRRDLGDVP